MPMLARFLRGTRVAFLLGIAAQLACAPNLAAQQAPPAEPEPLAPATFEDPIPADHLAFLNDYAGRMESDVLKDKRFRKALNLVTPHTAYFFGHDMELSEARDSVLDADPLPVSICGERYAMVSTRGGGFRGGRDSCGSI
jgi:hypothetical protein